MNWVTSVSVNIYTAKKACTWKKVCKKFKIFYILMHLSEICGVLKSDERI